MVGLVNNISLPTRALWGLDFVVRGFIPDGARSGPASNGAAAQPIGDESPHHRIPFLLEMWAKACVILRP